MTLSLQILSLQRFILAFPTSFEKLQLEVQSSIPATPIKFCEEWENGKDSSARTPCSSTVGHDTQCDSHCSKDERTKQNIHTVHGTCGNEVEIDAARKSKSLRFEESEDDLSSRGIKQSPHPTPLKISDDMQTPGTVYPATFKNQPNGHKPRVIINSQILYSDNHLAKSISQCEILEEEEEIVHLDQDSGNECKVEGSLSVIKEERHSGKETSHDQIPNLCKSPTERPVLGMVAAHWNEDEKLQIPSPESWYDNGIPNTTNKYKEDQKVNWRATPFEERLEKALSDKSFISQRNHVCGKLNTFENEDTEIFQLQPSTPPNL
ncbi:protein JASON-like [Prosopis cineraria]|uniref:protein JASON-like n=1 Tax=Prosopis cineraria TaxID=364024 RepID=UPI00240F02DD|nr:protein JASON-like [Prosopis cineraria]